ncbi:MAG: cadherin repeat domain-containing protein [Porticoccaceae bacterium]
MLKKPFCYTIVLLTACGGGSSAPQNTAPELVAPKDYSIDENTTEVARFKASDAEGDTLTYSISGADASLLSIDAASGVLTFQASPDYEDPQDNNSANIYSLTVSASDGQLSSSLAIVIRVNNVDEGLGGLNMLLMGNSFFRPYAERLEELAVDAGYLEHRDRRVTRGGQNGTPVGLWNNADTNAEIKGILDAGNIEIFGMTGNYNPDNPTQGFSEWIAYALQNNPNITVFISIPPFDFPADWQQRAEDLDADSIEEVYAVFVNDYIHKTLIDQLRVEFPSTKIFSIPTGWATFELAAMHKDNLLSDNISLFGSFENGIFTDEKGHQGKIVAYTGTLMWLNGLYQVNLRTDDFETGFSTDLHSIAEEIMNSHDPGYSHY